MDGEHAFSAAIILVMVNIAFPYNTRDRASMELALDVLNGMAEKGNAHIKSLHRLLLNLCSTIPPVSPKIHQQPTTVVQEHTPLSSSSSAQARPSPPVLDDPFAAFLAAQEANSAMMVGNNDERGGDPHFIPPEEFLSFENPTGDARLWEEGYGTFDMGMDFDWAQWTS